MSSVCRSDRDATGWEVCRWRTLSLILIDLLPPIPPPPFSILPRSFSFPLAWLPTGCSIYVGQRGRFFFSFRSPENPSNDKYSPSSSRRYVPLLVIRFSKQHGRSVSPSFSRTREILIEIAVTSVLTSRFNNIKIDFIQSKDLKIDMVIGPS